MKMAIPVYGEYVSNVFDFARQLLLVDIENGSETNRYEVALENKLLSQRALQLKKLGVEVLVCGAISQELATMVLSSGIEVLPFVTGNVEDVLGAYRAGQLTGPEFSMPGCRLGAHKGLGRRRRGCRWQRGQQQK
jgi:predicted Fe-Mo cluster-binding NifX family protein